MDILKGFFSGFVMLGEVALREGLDLPIYVSYFKKNEKVYIIDAPIMYSTLKKECGSKKEIAERLVNRCNELGKMDYNAYLEAETKPTEKD